MHTQELEVFSMLLLSRFSAVGDGMHVEISGSIEGIRSSPLITVREDEELGLQVVLHAPGRDVAFPLSELQRAIEFAIAEVHKESFYD